jgi:hypothetical protein
MNFYIYENWSAGKNRNVKVHRGNCPHCNYGKGQYKKKDSDKNGIWHPPYDSFERAWEAAVLIPDREESCCRICKPRSGR